MKSHADKSKDALIKYCEKFAAADAITLLGPETFPTTGYEGAKEPVIYVDGGTRHRIADEGLSIGDGDSYSAPPGTNKKLDVLLPHEKDYSDLSFVLRALPENFKHIQTFGFMGGRTDHQLINFGEAHHFLRRRENTVVVFDHEAWGLSPGIWRPRILGLFSVINFEACDVRLEGLCDYQIKEPVKLPPVTSRGLSNVGRGQIEIEASGPVFILTERRLHLERDSR